MKKVINIIFLIGAILLLSFVALIMFDVVKLDVDTELIITLVVFGLVFLFAFLYDAVRNIQTIKLLNDPNAYITTAQFVDVRCKENGSTGGKIFNTSYSVVVEYIDEKGNRQCRPSYNRFSYLQVQELRKRGSFSIKCKGRRFVII